MRSSIQEAFYEGYKKGCELAKEDANLYAEAVAEICSEEMFNAIEAEYNLRKETRKEMNDG